MIKFKKILFTALAIAALSVSFMGCSNSSDDDGSGTSKYIGSYTVNGSSYNTLTLSGTSSSGSASFTGSGGTLSGSYANGRGLTLSGSYTITFSSGTIIINITNSSNDSNVTLSNGSLTASGGGNTSGEEHWTSTSGGFSGTLEGLNQ